MLAATPFSSKSASKFTAAYAYEDAVRTTNDIAGELNRLLFPEGFWQAQRFTPGARRPAVKPRDIRSDPIYAASCAIVRC
jgi:hypothetical protein